MKRLLELKENLIALAKKQPGVVIDFVRRGGLVCLGLWCFFALYIWIMPGVRALSLFGFIVVLLSWAGCVVGCGLYARCINRSWPDWSVFCFVYPFVAPIVLAMLPRGSWDGRFYLAQFAEKYFESTAQSKTTTFANCGACGKSVSASLHAGDVCPHCHVRWARENTKTTRSGAESDASAPPSPTAMMAFSLIQAAALLAAPLLLSSCMVCACPLSWWGKNALMEWIAGGGIGIVEEIPNSPGSLRIRAHCVAVLAVAAHPREEQVVTAGADGIVRFWDARSGQLLRTIGAHSGSVNAIAFHPDGKRLITVGADSYVRIWDVGRGSCLATISGHRDSVYAVAVSPDGRRIASGGFDHTIRLWELETGRPIITLEPLHKSVVSSLAYSPNGQWLVSGSWDHSTRVWQADDGKPVWSSGSGSDVEYVAVSPDSKYFATAGKSGGVSVWELRSGKVASFAGLSTNCSRTVAFAPGSDRLFLGCAEHAIHGQGIHNQKAESNFPKAESEIYAAVYDPQGCFLAYGTLHGFLFIHNLREKR